jgi:hypothetical protein
MFIVGSMQSDWPRLGMEMGCGKSGFASGGRKSDICDHTQNFCDH